MSVFSVLHLSDIHIGKTYKSSEDIAYKIISDIYHGLCTLRSVVVTGDIFDGQATYSEKLINEAADFFETILKQVNLNQEEHQLSKEDFIFVPGNHDLIRADNEEEKWSKYKKFLSRFYGDIPKYYSLENFSVIRQYQMEKIVFIGFNSCQIEKKRVFSSRYLNDFKNNISADVLKSHGINKEELLNILENEAISDYDDFGQIPMAQIAEIEREIKKLDNYNVVALFHHHFYLFPEIAREFGDSSLIRNYTEVIHHLNYMNVKTVLHGHKHFDLERPFITDDYYNTTDSIIDVFAGGSVGTARKERHTFNIIDFYEKKDEIKLLHNKFIYNDEALTIAKKQIPPQNLAVRIVKLLEMLKTLNPNAHRGYTETVEKIFKIYGTCNEIIDWVSEAITGFSDVYKILDNDYMNILFVLYAISYRTLSYKKIVGKEKSFFDSASTLLKEFFKTQLAIASFNISIDEYHSLFGEKRLREVAIKCDQLLNKCSNKASQLYLAFSMLGVYFVDLYLVLTEYADDFKESIKFKVNIKIEENKFHENVPAPRIVIRSDADRRSVYVQLLCNEATAHKMAVLFVKEFDLLINKFEDYFNLIGLKLYYLIPKIDKDNLKDTLDNYNFEAYIPTLLPLLTGDNIYPSKVVFARELIQNSIDAIAVREAKEIMDFPKSIFVDISTDDNKKRYFKIRDYGTGMDRYKIERYFTSIGRSFYSGDEYADLKINYKPISNFGIGFLSSFMVCQEIDVKTKYFLPESEALKLHIPNYDGCFFIERDGDIAVGTELKLYLNCDLDNKTIIDYVKKTMLDIKYDIVINNIKIPAHQIREDYNNVEYIFFIPFTENDEVLCIDYEQGAHSCDFTKKYEYGMLICKHSPTRNNDLIILNAGILIEQASLDTLFYKELGKHRRRYEDIYNDIIINLPSSWIQLDVSREKLTGFSEHIKSLNKKNTSKLRIKIAEALYKQILGFVNYCKHNKVDLPVIYLQDSILYSLYLCGEDSTLEVYKELMALSYTLNARFTSEGITFELVHGNKKTNIPKYENTLAADAHYEWIHNYSNSNFIFDRIFRDAFDIHMHRELMLRINSISHKVELNKGNDGNTSLDILALYVAVLSYDKKDQVRSIIPLIENKIMEKFKISDVENGNSQINIRYEVLSSVFKDMEKYYK